MFSGFAMGRTSETFVTQPAVVLDSDTLIKVGNEKVVLSATQPGIFQHKTVGNHSSGLNPE